MNRRSFQRLSFAAIAGSLVPSLSRTLAQAPDASKISAWIDKTILDKDIAIDEVRAYIVSKLPKMPALKTPEEWTKWAAEHRQKVLDNVIYKGEAAKWRDAKGLKFERMGTVTTDGYLLTKVRFEALPGHWIPALLYEPAGLSADKKVPVHLAVNGHDANGYAADYKQTRCTHLAKKGVVSLSLEWYGMGQFRTPDYLHPMINTIDLTGTSGIATHYLAMKRGIDILLAHPNAEPTKVAVSGLSGGGWQTIFISSLDPRVTLANPVAGYSGFVTRTQHDMDLGDSEQTPTDLGTVTDYTIMTALRAPHATLLTFNAKDQCCFTAGHALPPLVAAAKPVYDLLKVPDKLGTHVNEDPGTHNFLEDNRKAFYRFLGTHFMGLKGAELDGFAKEEIKPGDMKKIDELKVALPADQLSLHGLAMNLAKNLPAPAELPKDKNGAEIWILEGRKKLREALKLPEAPAPLYDTFTPIGDRVTENGYVRQANLVRVADTWSVPFLEIFPQKATPKTTTFFLSDKGAGEFSADAAALLGKGERVVVCNPYYFGEMKPSHHNYLFSLLLGTVGDRPLGVEARQLAAALAMDRSRLGQSLRLVAKGKRAALVALCAAAISNEGTVGEVVLEGSLGSLKQAIEEKMSYTDSPEFFTFGLLQNFDIKQIAMLVAPAKLTFAAPSDRVKTDLAGLADWWKLLGVDHKPLG